MAVKEKSFWSTTSGIVTGIAGTLTGVVGIATLAAQMGWIGGSDGGNEPASVQSGGSVATAPGGAPSGTSSQGGQGTTTPVFSVDPTSLSFDNLGNREGTVRVVNDGSVPMTVRGPKVEGANPAQFSATSPTCTGRVIAPGRSCEIEVTFNADRSGNFRATLVVQVDNARPQDVALSGQRLI